jgi:DNA-binding transcriptional ArsR family regulator
MKVEHSDIFKALAVPTRLHIIAILKSKGPHGSKEIARLIGITPAAASQHLRVLRQAGLIRSERKGYWIPHSINEHAMENCCCIVEEICTCSPKRKTLNKECEIKKDNLEYLKNYKKKLEAELNLVQKRIDELKQLKK